MPAVAPSERSSVLKEEVSRAGRTVRLTLDKGTYKGAQPYYTVAYLRPSGGAQVLRYVPEAYGGNHQDIVPGGVMTPHEQREWKKLEASIRKRDGQRCKHCGTRDRLTVHHIKPRPDGTNDPRNLVTLCRPCHDALELPPEWAASASPEPTNGRPSVS